MYQVWTKAEYEDNWKLTECPDIAAVEDIIRLNFGKEVSIKVSVPVEFDAKIAVKVHAPEDKLSAKEKFAEGVKEPIKEAKSEATQSETEPDKGAGGKGHGKVR
jgi:hypothetical protein